MRPHTSPDETAEPERCPACGIYFEKWARRDLFVPIPRKVIQSDANDDRGWRGALRERVLHIPERVDAMYLYGRAAALVFLLVWGIRLGMMNFRTAEVNQSFMHAIVLPIHEAGHVLFIPLGHFMTILGGSLFQLLLPLIVAGALLWQNRDAFGAALGIWWCGVSLMDVSAYIYDAKYPQMMLLGGHTGEEGPHDWIYLLNVFGKVQQAQVYGALAHALGFVMMLAAVFAAAWALRRVWKHRSDDADTILR